MKHARESPRLMRFPPGWRVEAQRVTTEVEAKNFLDALDLFREVGEVADAREHHPDLHLESYNRVRIVSYSHDVGTLTARDEALAAAIEPILQRRGLRG